MPTINSDKIWEYFGKFNPYYGVITSTEYLQNNLNKDSMAKFFESGYSHIDQIMNIIHTYLAPDFKPHRALDFGCGVGRLVIPLAATCEAVVGVDISPSMLREAMKNCKQRGITNVEFVESDDSLSKVTSTFDFIHSFIVFQHIPRERGEYIFRRLIDLLEEDGIGVVHITYFRKSSKARKFAYWARTSVPFFNGLFNLFILKQPFNYPMMQMNEYNLGRLFQILQENGCHHSYIRFSDHTINRHGARTSVYGILLFFQKRTLVAW